MLNNCIVLGTRVAVELPKKKTQTEGGIVLPGQSTEMPNMGVVLQIGRGVFDKWDSVVRQQPLYSRDVIGEGDVVVWGPFATLAGPLNIEGKDVWFVDESDILIVKQNSGKGQSNGKN
jgi:co-chaperonin GroES (HSP10)